MMGVHYILPVEWLKCVSVMIFWKSGSGIGCTDIYFDSQNCGRMLRISCNDNDNYLVLALGEMNYMNVNENKHLISCPSERHHMTFSDHHVWIVPFTFDLEKVF